MRCPHCKSTVFIPAVTRSNPAAEDEIDVYATFSGEEGPRPAAISVPAVPLTYSPLDKGSEEAAATVQPEPPPPLEPPGLVVPSPTKLSTYRPARSQRTEPPAAPAEQGSAVTPAAPLAAVVPQPPLTLPSGPLAAALPALQVGVDREPEWVEIRIDTWQDRPLGVPRSSTRFMALCLGMLGLAMLAPILANWLQTEGQLAAGGLARWQAVQVFGGALLLAFAVYVDQVHDRAALWSISIVLLAVSCLHAAIGMGTWLDRGLGPFSRWLQIPVGLRTHATLWSFIYTLFAAILSCLGGYQAFRWQLAAQSALAESGSAEATSSR